MTNPLPSPQKSNRKFGLAAIALGGCGVLVLCVALALAANAVYWTARVGAANSGPVLDTQQVQPAVERLPEGSASRGEDLFAIEDCLGCHSLEPGERQVGPSLAGVAGRAADARPGYTAETFLYESIVAPSAFVAAGDLPGIMPGNYGQRLSEQQIADLIAFLMTR